MNIVEKIKTIPDLCHLSGCKTNQIKTAQKELDLEFPDEFIDYVMEFGVISFYGTEWTGLNVEGYLNVVEATKKRIDYLKNFGFAGETEVIAPGINSKMDENEKKYPVKLAKGNSKKYNKL